MTKSLALDASLTNCGYCIGIDGEYQESGQYKPYGKDWVEKIQNVSKWLYGMSMQHHFDIVFYEYPSGTRNHDTSLKLGALMYAVESFCRLRSIQVITVKPSEVKASGIYKVWDSKTKTVCRGILYRVRQLYSTKFTVHYRHGGNTIINSTAMKRQDDEIDAIGLNRAGWKKKWSKNE